MSQTRPFDSTPGPAPAEDTRPAPDLGGVRRGFDYAHVVLSALFLAAVLVQFFLAGYGAFAHHQGPHQVHHAFGPHEDLGNALGIVSVVLLVLALVARVRRSVWIGALVLAILTEPVQHALAQNGHDHRWLGGLHAVSAMVILGTATWLAVTGWHRRLRGTSSR